MSSPTDNPAAPQPESALVIKLGHIGDVLVTTPLMAALKNLFPKIRITALVNQGTEDMLVHSPVVDRLLVLRRDAKGLLARSRAQMGLLADLRREKYDLCLELSGGDRGAFLSLASGAGLRAGFRPKKDHPRARAFHVLADGGGTKDHMVRVFMRQLAALGMDLEPPGLVFAPGAEAEQRAGGLLAGHGLKKGGFALVHPTSRWMFKCWTAEGNARVIEHLMSLGLKVALTAAPAAHELAFAAEIKKLLGPKAEAVADFSGSLNLLQLGALIGRARLFFGVDSAPMHLAAALGVPTAVLFGPSGEQMWGPWRVPCRVITSDDHCRPCGADGCEGSKVSRCLVEIPASTVCEAIDDLLAETTT